MNERAALYLRVSTSEGEQTEENQRRELRKFAQEPQKTLSKEQVEHIYEHLSENTHLTDGRGCPACGGEKYMIRGAFAYTSFVSTDGQSMQENISERNSLRAGKL